MDNLVLQIMKETVKGNIDPTHRCFFVDKLKQVAFGGHRRTWGIGDLFTRFKGDFNFEINPGIYNVESNEFFINKNLPSEKIEGQYTELTIEEVEEKFQNNYANLEGFYQVDLNPKEVLDFIDDATFRKGKQDALVNLQPTAGVVGRQFPAAVFKTGDGKWIIEVQTREGKKGALIQEEGSLISFNRLKDGDYYVCEIVGEINGHRYVKLLRPYVPGVRIAVQHLKNGTIMHGHPGYSILPYQDGNSIQVDEVTDLKFLPSQDMKKVQGAPMLTIQMDTFLRILKSCATFKYIRITYRDEFSLFLVETLDNVPYSVEILASPITPYVKGKVITL